MTIKCTMFFVQNTAVSSPNAPIHRQGGWTESWYYPGVSVPAARAAFGDASSVPNLCSARAAMLPLGASIVAQRYQVVAPTVSPAQLTSFNYTSPGGVEGDYPQGALLCRVPALGASNVRRAILRGLPDSVVTEGEYTPSFGFGISLAGFFGALQPFAFRGRDLSQPVLKIINVTAAGVVTTETNITLTVGQMVRVLKTQTSAGSLKGGRFQVSAVGPGSNVFTLLNWALGATTGGSVRPDLVVYPMIDSGNISVSRVVTRRVGRPFVTFRGRRSTRRR
jgi:hypothetical protein